ncbi:ATP-binding cassette domain-containing protein [Actinomadura sp. ATCC 31491]|uniref:ATP-binding cassette domain-containing protein n=1 Tax=Actinomadura luzonensis TaxID=2805427 RepID=A0ABT0FXA0_9ACTN|nr:ATP-binding cassette domain-containing protein [Actinomadura luzonensis]MCK2216969.1 ATP-binding cassette domain-containing protein [Actinomadura luzonensis]
MISPRASTEPPARPGPADAGSALAVRGLRKSFSGRTVLAGLDLALAPGEFLALLGANGSGKSTALRCVVGLERADAGEVLVHGRPLGASQADPLRRRIAMIFQQVHLVHRRSALDNVCAGALGRLPLHRSLTPLLFPDELREEAMACLDRVGMAGRAAEPAGRLSGGQRQRVAIARALCQRAEIILADEPVSALDPVAAEQVVALLAELAHEQGLAVAAVLHQPDLARRHADRVAGLLHGRLALDAPAAGLTPADLAPLYAPDRDAPAQQHPDRHSPEGQSPDRSGSRTDLDEQEAR